MPKTMLIDAGNPEEVRVCLLENGKVEDFDFESASRKPLRGNIYLARVTRVEPSLQAAFIEYGGNRHGFLAFGEIHPDYYQIPISDRRAIQEAEAEEVELAARLNLTPTGEEDGYEGGLHGFVEDGDEGAGPDGLPGDDSREESRHSERSAEADSASPRIEPAGDETRDVFEDEPSGERAAHAAGLGARPKADDAISSEMLEGETQADDHGDDHGDDDGDNDGDDDAEDDAGRLRTGVEEAGAATVRRDAGDADEDEGDSENDEIDSHREGASIAGSASLTRAERAELMERYKEARRRRARLLRNYKIQEVIKRRQILLIQVVKEERGNKGAALTTYMSLAGRYCVLMPNTARGGGISRKIPNASDRKRLRRVVDGLDVPQGMGLIIRTAGASRTKAEIKRDYDYLIRLWENIRTLTLKSIAPCLIYEEASLIKRAIRDLYDKDIDQVLVDGEAGYREAKDFMKMLMPSHAKNVQPYKEPTPLFLRYGVEAQLDAMYQPIVRLKSGGYIVINQTEALIAIDVNSGKSTRERNVELTALRTNLEAAKEVARQCRMRDLAGLIVVDFIDMEEGKNNRAVEKRIKEAMKTDRARIQIGRISSFGLLEMSRQRRRSGIVDGTTHSCSACGGAGVVRSPEMAALRILRSTETEAITGRAGRLIVRTATNVALYILNNKRDWLRRVEEAYGVAVEVTADPSKAGDQFEIETSGSPREVAPQAAVVRADLTESEPAEVGAPDERDENEDVADETPASDAGDRRSADSEGAGRKRRRRRRRKPGDSERGDAPRNVAQDDAARTHLASADPEDEETGAFNEDGEASGDGPARSGGEAGMADRTGDLTRKRRRRGRRGGRRSGRGDEVGASVVGAPDASGGEFAAERDAVAHELAPTPHSGEREAQREADERTEAPASLAHTPPREEAVSEMVPTFLIEGSPGPDISTDLPETAAAKAAEPVNPPVPTAPAPVDKSGPVRKGWWQRALGN